MIHTFTQKRPGERETFSFDVTNLLGGDEIIQSVTAAVTVKSGTDAGAAAMAVGLPSFGGKIVSQSVSAGVAGNYYYLTFTITTNTQTLQLVGVIPVTGA